MGKVKVAFIAPCIGIGGADALMLGLVKYAHNLDIVGIAIHDTPTLQQIKWFEQATGKSVLIHQSNVEPKFVGRGIYYHPTWEQAVQTATARADIIHTWCTKNLDVLENIDLPVIEYAQNTDEWAKEAYNAHKSHVDYRVACSKAATSVFADDNEPVSVIYNGIDPGRVAPRKGREIQRSTWAIKPEQKVLLFMGRFVQEKHPLSVVNALQYLPEEWLAVFVGTGPEHNELYKVCKQFAPLRTAFVKPEYHVGDFLASADCFVLPSDFEGHPLALMEAMLAGVPCVYTDLPVMQELHEQLGPMGVMVPMCSSGEDIATAILAATTQTDETYARIMNARNQVWHNFTLPTIAHQWEEYIESCLFDSYRRRRYPLIHPNTPNIPVERAHG